MNIFDLTVSYDKKLKKLSFLLESQIESGDLPETIKTNKKLEFFGQDRKDLIQSIIKLLEREL